MTILNFFLLLGGLGLFLYGMKVMEEGLEAAAGDKLRGWLEMLTKNKFIAVLVGTGVTAIIQSSSATTVMTVGFVNAGLMTPLQAICVNMGANIGTAVTAQMISFKIGDIAPLAVFIGVVAMMFIHKRSINRIGMIFTGLGVLFVGLNLMSEAMYPLRSWEPFIHFMAGMSNPIMGILTSMLFTCVIQSSSATMGVLITLANQGILTYEGSVYMILGCCIGTCITALLASIGSTKAAKTVAVAHLVFNIFAAIVFGTLMSVLPIVEWIGNLTPGNAARQMANFQMIYKIIIVAIVIWYPQALLKISQFVVRGEDDRKTDHSLKYITKGNKRIPATIAIGQVIHETQRMMDYAHENIKLSFTALSGSNEKLIQEIAEHESVVDYLNFEITSFLSSVSQSELSEGDSKTVSKLFRIVSDIERLSDHAENIGELASYRTDSKVVLSDDAISEIRMMSDKVLEALENSRIALMENNIVNARKVVEIEQEVDDMEDLYRKNHIDRLTLGVCSPKASMLFEETITNLERIADHCTNIAFYVIEGKL